MTTTQSNVMTTYQNLLNGLCKDALETAEECEISPEEALANIIEALHYDAADRLSKAEYHQL